MTIATYTDLTAPVGNWLHRTDLAAIIPDFITLAEKRINGDLDARQQDTDTTLSTVASTVTVAAPSDVVNIRSLTVQSSPNTVLNYLTPDQFNDQYKWGETGTPRSFTIIGSNIYFGPTPDAVYSVQCIYKARVPSLSAGSPTNWLLTAFPSVYLNAALIEGGKYLKWALPDIADLEKRYAEAVESVNSTDWYSGSTMRVRQDVRL